MEISSKDLSLNEKLKILADAAKYDVACTSSGSSRRGNERNAREYRGCWNLS